MILPPDFEQVPEQLGLTETDKRELEESGKALFEKFLKDYPDKLPDIIVFPDTTARPLMYIVDEILTQVSLDRNVEKPIPIFFWAHFPLSKEINQDIIRRKPGGMDFQYYISHSEEFEPESEDFKEIHHRVRQTNTKRAQEIIKKVESERHGWNDGLMSRNLTIISIDDGISDVATTTREISIAFGQTISTYAFVSKFTQEYYTSHHIPVTIGLTTDRDVFDFKKDKSSIGFYKDNHYTKPLYPMYELDDNDDTDRRMVKMMYLREDMRKVGKRILETLDYHSVWTEPDFIDLKEGRNLKEADLTLIESLTQLPKEIALDHHNYFSLNGDRCLATIDKDIVRVSERLEKAKEVVDQEKLQSLKAYLEIQKQIIEKYDWQTAWNINVVLERRKKKPIKNIIQNDKRNKN